jgi:hypothetical protein
MGIGPGLYPQRAITPRGTRISSLVRVDTRLALPGIRAARRLPAQGVPQVGGGSIGTPGLNPATPKPFFS